MAVELLISTTNTIEFKVNGVITNGDVFAARGNTIEFFSNYRFAIFIKGRLKLPAKLKKPPFSLRYVRHGSPAVNDQLVWGSDLKTQKQRAFIKLKTIGIGPGDRFPYGVALLDDHDTILTKDPQIIIQ